MDGINGHPLFELVYQGNKMPMCSFVGGSVKRNNPAHGSLLCIFREKGEREGNDEKIARR